MPTLTRMWKLSTATTPITTNVPARSGAVCAFCVKRISTIKYNSITVRAPTNPCSSAKAAKMKSAWWQGKNRRVRLGAGPAPPETPGTYRNKRLNHLITRALAVRLGLHETGQPIALIGFQHMERQRHHQPRQNYHSQSLLQANSA